MDWHHRRDGLRASGAVSGAMPLPVWVVAEDMSGASHAARWLSANLRALVCAAAPSSPGSLTARSFGGHQPDAGGRERNGPVCEAGESADVRLGCNVFPGRWDGVILARSS